MLLITAILSLVLAILLGLYLLTYILQSKDTPKGLVFIHGPLGAIGIIALLIYSCFSVQKPIVSLIILILALIGGFILIFKDLTGHRPPKWLAIGHGITALIGFGFLLCFYFYRLH